MNVYTKHRKGRLQAQEPAAVFVDPQGYAEGLESVVDGQAYRSPPSRIKSLSPTWTVPACQTGWM